MIHSDESSSDANEPNSSEGALPPIFSELFLEPDEPVASSAGTGPSGRPDGVRHAAVPEIGQPGPATASAADRLPDGNGDQPTRAVPGETPELEIDVDNRPIPIPDAISLSPGVMYPVPDDVSLAASGIFSGPEELYGGTQPAEKAPTPDQPADGELRKSALQGGAYLAVRELVGMGIRVMGVVIVTREIGPHSFGIYAGAFAFIVVAVTVAQMGMEVYLIRQPEEPTRHHYDEVFTFIAILSALTVCVSLGLSVLVLHLHPTAAPAIRVFRILLISVPLNALWAPAQARIERSFGFRKMAMLELGGDVILYGIAAPLAIAGWGAYALVVGVIAWQVWLLVGSYRMARMLPRLRLPRSHWQDFMQHGLAYSSSSWVNSILGLTNPIVVGRFFGATGVGYVALASRLVDTVGFAQRATWRLGLVALSKVQSDGERARRGVEEGMVLQVLMVAVPMTAVAVLGKLIIPFVFGARWLPALSVFALLGTASVLNAPLTVQMALLYSRAKNQAVVVACVLNAVIIFGMAFLLVPVMGIDGYGLAAVIGTVGWLVIYRQARRIQAFNPLRPIPWLVAFVPAMLFPLAPSPECFLLLAPLLLPVAVPAMRRQLKDYIVLVLSRVRRIEAAG